MNKVLAAIFLFCVSQSLLAGMVDMKVGTIMLQNGYKDSLLTTRNGRVGKISNLKNTIDYSIGKQTEKLVTPSKKDRCRRFEENIIGDILVYSCMLLKSNVMAVTMISTNGTDKNYAGLPANFKIEKASTSPINDLLQMVYTFKPLDLVAQRKQREAEARLKAEEETIALPEYDELPEYAYDF